MGPGSAAFESYEKRREAAGARTTAFTSRSCCGVEWFGRQGGDIFGTGKRRVAAARAALGPLAGSLTAGWAPYRTRSADVNFRYVKIYVYMYINMYSCTDSAWM